MEIACLYLPDFAAWVRRQVNPAEHRVAVHARGRITARSASLRQAGLMVGCSLERARAGYPEASFCVQDAVLEASYWEEILLQVYALTPRLLSGRHGLVLFETDDHSGFRLLAHRLAACGGAGPTRLVAMLAALTAGTRHVLNVGRQHAGTFLNRIPTDRCTELGISEEVTERLALLGYGAVSHLLTLSRRHLVAQFGREGERLYGLLHPEPGQERVPLFRPPPVITEHCDFEWPAIEPGLILPVLDHLAARAAGRLGARHCRRVRLDLSSNGTARAAHRVLKEPAAGEARLRLVLAALFRQLQQAPLPVERVEIELGSLALPAPVQGQLFYSRPGLYAAVRAVHARFPNTILRAVVDYREAYLPEQAFHFEPFPEEPPAKSRMKGKAKGGAKGKTKGSGRGRWRS